MEYPLHEGALHFPPTSEADYALLVADIEKNGQLEPITLYEGKLVDGAHRLRACNEIGIAPKLRQWDGNGSLVSFSYSLNRLRRHLTESQNAFMSLEAERLFADEAKQRYAQTVGRPSKESVALMPPITSPPRKARDDAAKMFGVSPRYVQDAKRIERDAPEKAAAIRAGTATITQVNRELKREATHERIREQAAAPALTSSGKLFPVIYVDPPWRYEDGTTDATRVIENQYPTMSLDDIKALNVPALGDAVLFMWATSPKLGEAFEVLAAWGFNYRTCAVWVKPRIGMGYYFRQRHELLLVATRGALPVPEPSARRDSVFSTDEMLRHSEKPSDVRAAIEKMYPDLPRLEMFARKAAEGWAAWGNEVLA